MEIRPALGTHPVRSRQGSETAPQGVVSILFFAIELCSVFCACALLVQHSSGGGWAGGGKQGFTDTPQPLT